MEEVHCLNSKQIKNFILDSTNDLENLFDFLDRDYFSSVEGIFHAIFSLLKNYEQNKSRVDYLIHIMGQLVEIKQYEEAKLMIGPINDFNHKVSNWSLKEKIAICDPYNEIQKILNKIYEKELNDISREKVRYLNFLIFQDKNLKMIENFLNINGNLLKYRNQDGDNIFLVVLNKYLSLEEKNLEEISYYYQVILLFIRSKYGKDILNNRKEYFRLIKRTKLGYSEHIIKIMELLDPEFSFTLRELESRYQISFNFPNIILEEMNHFIMDNQNRYNFTNQSCITIDGKGSKCLDDAIYLEKNENGTYTLYIHIVDIPSFIPFDSITNEEAMYRAETLYLMDRNILLYPDYISNYICSLLPNNNRNVISYIFLLDDHFEVIEDSFRIVKGKINVKNRMTYDEVDKRIVSRGDSSLDEMLYYLYQFSSVRRKDNQEKEKYRLLQNATYFNPNHESLRIDYSPAANIVHESMILVNYRVAKYFKDLSLPYIYRKLELPSNDFIDEQLNKLRKLDSKYIQSKEFLYQLKESYARPKYTVTPTYHSGLRLECYSHSSSPARRYSDSYGQYMIYDMIFGNLIGDFNIKAWEYRADKVVRYLNERKDANEVFSSQYNYLSYKKLIKGK